ncbi:hypothetical protein GCM10023205_23740 [Yinghuangia aomiensis]|uniref:Uncharacterized protein n=1 Tax=Yinghuangia aomiensis TaxID=676205 RepID=A0ABP9H296_9ACTN
MPVEFDGDHLFEFAQQVDTGRFGGGQGHGDSKRDGTGGGGGYAAHGRSDNTGTKLRRPPPLRFGCLPARPHPLGKPRTARGSGAQRVPTLS